MLAWPVTLPLLLAPAGVGPDAIERARALAPGATGVLRAEHRVELRGVPLLQPGGQSLRAADGTLVHVPAARSIPPPVEPFVPLLTADQALAAVAREAGRSGSEAALVAVPRPSGTRLAWKVALPLDRRRLSRPVYLVDARTGATWKWMEHVVDADVRVFPVSPVVTPDAEIRTLNDVDVGTGRLVGTRLEVLNCLDPVPAAVSCSPTAVAGPDANGDYLVPTPALDTRAGHVLREDAFSEVTGYYHGDRYLAWLASHGLPGLPCEQADGITTMVVNFRYFGQSGWIPLDNASYTADCELTIAMGQGRNADWAYDGDVIYHEMTHGALDERNGPDVRLVLNRPRADALLSDAGAMGEGISDFISSVLAGDPIHGDYVSQMNNTEGRSADNDLRCPDDIGGEVHADGEIFAGALWDAYQAVGEAIVPVVLDGAGALPGDATFEEGAAAISDVARAVLSDGEAAAVEAAFEARGLTDCPRVAPLEGYDRQLRLVAKGWEDGGYDPMRPSPVQLHVDVPENAVSLIVDFDVVVHTPAGWDPVAQVEVLVKHDEPITFEYDWVPDGVNTVEADPDDHVLGLNDGHAEIPVHGGRRVHLAFFNRGLHSATLSGFSYSFETLEGGGSTGGTTGADDDFQPALAGGCGCSGGGGGPSAWMLVVLLPGFRRRANRR